MNKEDYEKELSIIETSYKAQKIELAKVYAFANNPYKVGDIIRDSSAIIRIESIKVTIPFAHAMPSCVYKGASLKKDLTERKDGAKGFIYQINIHS